MSKKTRRVRQPASVLNARPLNGYVEARRLAAFHEAGHAAMLWFFNQEHLIKEIALRGLEGFLFTYHRPLPFQPDPKSHGECSSRSYFTMLVMQAFAGPCAEANCDEINDVWFTLLYDDFDHQGFGLPLSLKDDDDMRSAVAAAQQLYGIGQKGNISAYLRLCARWTQEAVVNDLRVIVSALADALLATNAINGDQACQIINATTGGGLESPIKHGRWRRRFKTSPAH